MKRHRIFWVGGLAAGLILLFVAFHAPSGRSGRQFDPERLADLEVRMWQAYYGKERVRLFALLVTTLREQYGYSWAKATIAAFHLARAATTFAEARAEYEQVLPDLERAYSIAKDWTHGQFDPAAVARTELAWWVARRTPGQNSIENVGGKIADEYALLYGISRNKVLESALLRAQAAAIRDHGGQQTDWQQVAQLLRDSYRGLHMAISLAR